MNTLSTSKKSSLEARARTSRAIAARIEALREERLRTFAETGMTRTRTALERSVDDLLDSLHDLHRLEQLAEQVALGRPVSVVADRLLIAAHEETFHKLLEEAVRLRPQNAKVLSAFAPAYPTPID
jgi:hypothetical protein